MVAVTKTLRDFMAECNVRPNDAALFCHVTRSAISHWRSGKKRPHGFNFDRLRLLLHCSAGELDAALDATKQQRDGGKPNADT